MKNPAPYIRKAMFNLLNGTITYGGNVVEVFEGEGEILASQIIIGNYSHKDDSDKNSFRYRAVQSLEIITIKDGLNPSKDSDAIAELVMNMIKPTTRITENLSSSDFQVMIIGAPDMDPLREESVSGQKVVRRLLRYNILVIEV